MFDLNPLRPDPALFIPPNGNEHIEGLVAVSCQRKLEGQTALGFDVDDFKAKGWVEAEPDFMDKFWNVDAVVEANVGELDVGGPFVLVYEANCDVVQVLKLVGVADF